MPSTYAHYRFGCDVLKRLPPEITSMLCVNLDLYYIGLHGPDIYFYYSPLTQNSVNAVGYSLHEKPAAEFFTNARSTVLSSPGRAAALAYIMGFICHFALDSTCHPYVEDVITYTGVRHTEIEVEFDSALMRSDGIDPVTHRLTDHIAPTLQNAEVISRFFPPITPLQTQKALKSMVRCNNLLIAPSEAKRALIRTMLAVTGNYKEMHGLLVNKEPNLLCCESTKQLCALYDEAVPLAVRLITQYRTKLYTAQPLDEAYNHTFGVN